MTDDVVVVGIDGSPTSQAALQWAVEVAGRSGSGVDAVRAWRQDVVFGGALPDALSMLQSKAQEAADEQVDQAVAGRPPGARPVRVRSQLREGDPASELLAASARASLLVLGRHGQGGWQRRLVGPVLGSVAGRCLTCATVPVAIVPPEVTPTPAHRVVVGIDGSAAGGRALRWAVQHARAAEAPVVAVLAWELDRVPVVGSGGDEWSPASVQQWEAHAGKVLDATVRDAVDPEQAAQVERLVLHRSAAAGLLGTVSERDVLVLGERGRGGFARLLLGSVSRQCAEYATCPVIVVPPQDRRPQPT